MKRGEDETLSVHTQLATLGVTAPKADGGRLADVPPSPWLHAKYWIEKKSVGSGCRMSTRCSGCTLKCHPAASMCGRRTSEPRRCHGWPTTRYTGKPSCRSAGFAEMALAAGCQALGLPVDAVQVNALEIEQALVLDGQTRVTTQLTQGVDGNRVEIHASSAGGNWSRYAVATST